MKYLTKSLFLIFSILAFFSNAGAQVKRSFDTSFVNTKSTAFFTKNPVIDTIEYSVTNQETTSVTLYLKSVWFDSAYSGSFYNRNYTYDFNFAGDIYRFEKKYGYFARPETEVDALLQNKRFLYPSINCLIDPDSVHCRVIDIDTTQDYDPEDYYYIKAYSQNRYKPSKLQLQKEIETAFNSKNSQYSKETMDSVLFFKVLIAKDGCLKRVELTDGNYSRFASTIMDILKGNCNFKPVEAGSRQVNAYVEIFCRLNKDGSITVSLSQ